MGFCGVSCSGRLTHACLLQIGNVKVGSEHKIALQTMTTTDTRDIDGTVDQVGRAAVVKPPQAIQASRLWRPVQ